MVFEEDDVELATMKGSGQRMASIVDRNTEIGKTRLVSCQSGDSELHDLFGKMVRIQMKFISISKDFQQPNQSQHTGLSVSHRHELSDDE